eukprot:TRINITY_DN6415_c0_g1_i1.p1 TRINITY_DN6415_c0_g1~~TRINITY_DN6415_c0_g1_i1.p1  ORF type:complete len:861 (+),score=232.76 TRINITY_DN6415_c0_g1_i1:156-2585(+)
MKGSISCVKFSPCSKYFAVGVGRRVRIFRTPPLIRALNPLEELEDFRSLYDDIVSIAWSPDSKIIAASSKDLSVRVWPIEKTPGFGKLNLLGFKTAVIGLCFISNEEVVAVCQDGAVTVWKVFFDEERKVYRHARSSTHFASTLPSSGSAGRIQSVAFHVGKKSGLGEVESMIALGFSSGVFSLVSMPAFEEIHSLSISSHAVSTVSINCTGEWIAFGSAKLGQIVVWEWKSESYVLKQQGHAHELNCSAYSPNGQLMCTGGDDGKVKIWNNDTGYCFVTFSEHSSPVTGITFTSRGNVVLSASLDGTVRAFDLVRYRNFRTLTPPAEDTSSIVQFTCLACDPSGDIVCAGSMDPFNVYVWSLRTSKLLDILQGHEAPISCLAFSSSRNVLVTGSWDKTVRVWDVYSSKSSVECLKHSSDVLALAINPQGTQLCTATLDGQLYFWNLAEGTLEGTIDGCKDILGGRKQSDARDSKNSFWGDHFTTVTYSPDGSVVLAGGNSKYICMYEVSQRTLIKKFVTTFNRSLDGVLNKLDSRELTEAGVSRAQIEDDEDEKFNNFQSIREQRQQLPGVQFGDFSSRKQMNQAIRTKHVAFSPNGDNWAAATTEGMMIFSLDQETAFDPVNLGMEVTPENIELTFSEGEYAKALLMSLRLNEKAYIQNVVKHCPPDEMTLIVRSVPNQFLPKLIEVLAELLEQSQSLEYLMMWCQNVLSIHGTYLKKHSNQIGASLGSMQKCLHKHYQVFSELSDSNRFNLSLLANSLRLKQKQEKISLAQSVSQEAGDDAVASKKHTDKAAIRNVHKRQKIEIEV